MTTRRYEPPWSAEVTPNCFIVRDAGGQTLGLTIGVTFVSRLDRVELGTDADGDPITVASRSPS